MARYDKEHKAATRLRILETAGRRLKSDGIDGSGVSTLMKDAGLTNGAFYAHFDSKDALIAEVVGRELHTELDRLAAQAPGPDAVEVMVRGYLSAEHRDNPGLGCPSAALLDEIARSDDTTRGAYTEAATRLVEEIATRTGAPPRTSDEGIRARTRVASAYALMVGTLQLARALTDVEASDRLLEDGLETALSMLGLDPG